MQSSFMYKNENHLHLNALSCKMPNIHRALMMIIPHQPARIETRSRMVGLIQVYELVTQHTFLLLWCAGFFIGSVGLVIILTLFAQIS